MTSISGADGVSESADRAARELRVLFSRLLRRLREVSDGDDLTPPQVSALNRLGKTEAATASGLAAAEGVRPQSMAATLAGLDQHGLIRRRPDPEDGRRRLVTLTEAGRARAEGTRQARGEWLARELQDRYTEDERRTIVSALTLLERLTEA
ncbi:MarR family transcriptional regulator [Streptomyces sp. NPDC046821]|uniref:MarR family transcriptional regulator n=1 Tax=Streptomyces sp. NPDC046821 TaxID=3154702 RepID=UPI0034022F6D